jgi:hypothetical protein
MIKLETILILTSLIIGLVNAHGGMTDPPGRIPVIPWHVQSSDFSGGINMAYYYRGIIHINHYF